MLSEKTENIRKQVNLTWKQIQSIEKNNEKEKMKRI